MMPESIRRVAADLGPVPILIAAGFALAVILLYLFLRLVAGCQMDADRAVLKAAANREGM